MSPSKLTQCVRHLRDKMNEYTSTYKLFREVVSIKRAQWTFVWLMFVSVSLVVGLGCYGAASVSNQINTISQSVAAETHSRAKLQNRILQLFASGVNGDFYQSLVVGFQNVMIRVNTFVHHNTTDGDKAISCPASSKYKKYLLGVSRLPVKPIISNVFLFAGGHGLGKSYASYQLGRALSRFSNVIMISLPMMSFGNINNVGVIVEGLEQAMGGAHNSYIIWTFDELDSYVMHNKRDMRDKSITEFAEYTGFIKSDNRVLVFTMNNAEIIMHDYWSDRATIVNNITAYPYAEDYRRALDFTGLEERYFLQEGQLSRLYSFVGNKLFVFKKFNTTTAREFAQRYLTAKNIEYTLDTDSKLFSAFSADHMFNVRELKIALDDIVNKI
ncbi:cyun143 [Cyclophragma undans nucleopolyhedrovirus]|uniref:Cyun143 n=1 Tax=Cyclophragma undans nucleopolyhedrovirus TaxID=1906244 RepID=A0A288QB77_9ABAC|nr:cyun143 [Cyclophragma undans nucleopolyhedrovirus]AOT85601.1 cyun143 [Cyclophragma undans nucleopolyhedrovirus]